MNCQELMQLLDDGDIRTVPAAKRRELDAHLSQCADCAAEWRVQERIVMTQAMSVPAGFLAQCRQLVAAGAARMFVGRRVILYSSLLIMAAAAALLGWRYATPETTLAVVAAPIVEAAPVLPSAQVQPELEPAPEPATLQPVVTPPGTFTVAVPPLQAESIDAEGNALAARFRERVMTLLQGIPNLVLVDAPPAAGGAMPDHELRMTYSNTLPAPLSRMVRLEVRNSAEFAATQAAIAAEAGMSPEDQQRSKIARERAGMQKRMTSMRNGNTGLSLMLGNGVPSLAIFYDRYSPTDRLEAGAQQLIRELRVNVFPLDATFEQAQLTTLRNSSERQALRMRALGALLLYAERRGGFSHAGGDVIRAGGELALVWEGATSYDRGTIWDGLALTASPELVPYLIRGLDESPQTETRLQLVKILTETYGDDPRAQAALATAATSNAQQTVRMAAMHGSDGSQWRDYVVATLGNPGLSSTQRLQPIAEMAPGEAATLGTSPSTGMVLEAQQLRELGALIIKVAPDRTANEIARKALFAAGAMDTPAALDMLIEVADALRAENFARGLEGVSVMGLRDTAHSLISMRYAGHPKARAVIEGLARSGDPLAKMMAETQLRTMDMKGEMEKARQNPQPAQPPSQ